MVTGDQASFSHLESTSRAGTVFRNLWGDVTDTTSILYTVNDLEIGGVNVCCLSLVDDILNILNQPGVIGGTHPHFPQITDLSQLTSEAIIGSGDVDPLEPSPINLPPTVSFVNGKHEVPAR